MTWTWALSWLQVDMEHEWKYNFFLLNSLRLLYWIITIDYWIITRIASPYPDWCIRRYLETWCTAATELWNTWHWPSNCLTGGNKTDLKLKNRIFYFAEAVFGKLLHVVTQVKMRYSCEPLVYEKCMQDNLILLAPSDNVLIKRGFRGKCCPASK